jgi:hypothetical protein
LTEIARSAAAFRRVIRLEDAAHRRVREISVEAMLGGVALTTFAAFLGALLMLLTL